MSASNDGDLAGELDTTPSAGLASGASCLGSLAANFDVPLSSSPGDLPVWPMAASAHLAPVVVFAR